MNARRTLLLGAAILTLLMGSRAGAQDDTWTGELVFLKNEAVAKVGEVVIDKNLLDFPAMVKEVKGDWVWLGRAWVKKSDCLKQDEALVYFTEAVRRNPKSSEAYRRRAACLRNGGEEEKGKADLEKAIELDPKNARAFNDRGMVKFEVMIGGMIGRAMRPAFGAIAGAIAEPFGGKAASDKEEEKEELDERGMTKEEKQALVDSVKDFDEAIRLDPKFAAAYRNRGMSKSELEDLPGALSDFEAAVRLDEKDEVALGLCGLARLENRDYAGAVKDLDRAIVLDPKNGASYRDRGNAKERLKDFSGALADFDEALKLNPEDSLAMHLRGVAKTGKKDYAGAIKDFDEAIMLGGAMGFAMISKAVVLSTAQDATVRQPAEALKLAEALLQADPKNGNALVAKACALAAEGQFEKALELEKLAGEDKNWARDDSDAGGVHSEARVAAWKAGKIWQP